MCVLVKGAAGTPNKTVGAVLIKSMIWRCFAEHEGDSLISFQIFMFRSSSVAQRKINRLTLFLTPIFQVSILLTRAGCHRSAESWENWQQICHHGNLQGLWPRTGWKATCIPESAAAIIQQASLSEVKVANPLCLPSSFRIPVADSSWLRDVTSTMSWIRWCWSSLSPDYWREYWVQV